MDSANNEISIHLNQRIDEYRQKLLDLSTSNVLISFKHDLKSKTHVRIIDERPDIVFEKLVQGRELELLPLPEPRELPDDETTAGFASALEQFKAEDPIYLEQCDSLKRKQASKEDIEKLERRARDRVRHNLGMPPWTPEAELTPAELARTYGLEPDFDLAKPDGQETPGRHLDDALQTLHSAKALDDKLRGLGERARSSVREVGISTLYCAYGFLEWHDDQDKTTRFAPLFLQSAGLRRQLVRGRYRYFVSGTDQPVAHNASLDHYLQKRHAIALPLPGDNDTPEIYFEKIETWLTREKPRWCLRRFLTIGVFPFSKLALYEDLNLDNWTDRQGFIGHPTIRQLLASAGDSASPVADDYHLDEFDLDQQLPPLIYEADSSQHSAIFDALSGHNTAIQGPPGTGKSQTIANVLAAVMAAGKSVLFIAEKQAALDVVADRLKKAGLGDYCLVLHAHDAKKQAIVQSFGDRLQMAEPPFDRRLYEETRQEWLKTRLVLKDYAEVMATRVGRLSETVHDILWKALPAAGRMSRPCLEDIAFERVEALTDADLRNARDALRQLDAAWRAAVDDKTGTPLSSWHGAGRTDASPLVLDDALRRAQRWLDAVERASALSTAIPAAPEGGSATLAGMDRVARLAENLPHLPNSRWLTTSAQRLLRVDDRERVLTRARDLRTVQTVTEALAAFGDPAGIDGWSIDDLSALLDEVRLRGVSERTPAGLRGEAALAQSAADAVSGIISVVSHFGRILELEGSSAILFPLALRVAECLAQVEPRLLWARTTALMDVHNRQAIEDAEVRYNELVKARGELARAFRVEQLPAVSELRSHAEALRTTSLLPLLDARVSRATKAYRTIALEPGKPDRHRMAAHFDELADFLARSLAFAEDRQFREIFGPGFRGLDTDLTRFREVADWAVVVSRQFRGLDPQHRRIREALHHGDGPLLDELHDLGGRLHDLVRQAGLQTGALDRPLGDLERTARERADAIRSLFERLKHLGLGAVDRPLEALLNKLIGNLRRRADLSAALAARAPADPDPGGARQEDLAFLAQLNGIVLDAGLAAAAFQAVCDPVRSPAALARAIDDVLGAESRAWTELAADLEIDETAFFRGGARDTVPIAELRERARTCALDRAGLKAWLVQPAGNPNPRSAGVPHDRCGRGDRAPRKVETSGELY